MPIYEYLCRDCGHEMEALQKLSDNALEDCPECRQPALKKKISASAFRLKGGGWYETDFKTGDKKNLSKSDTGKSAKDANGAKTVTDKNSGESVGKNVKEINSKNTHTEGGGKHSTNSSSSNSSKAADNKTI